MEGIDSVATDILTTFAVDIIKRISEKTKIDPDVLATSIPGLCHSHWYIPSEDDEPVRECLYCARVKKAGAGN